MESKYWFTCGFLAFTIVNKQFFPPKLGTPEDTFASISTSVVAQQLLPIGKALLAIANGKVPFKTITHIRNADEPRPYSGMVYTIGDEVGANMRVPMARNTFVHIFQMSSREEGRFLPSRGVQLFPLLPVDPYGEYRRRFNWNMLTFIGSGATFDAIRFADDGRLLFCKDMSDETQSLSTNEHVSVSDNYAKRVDIYMFRCSHVCCFQRINPQTCHAFARFTYLNADTLQEPLHFRYNNDSDSPATIAFLAPDTRVFIMGMDGSPESPEVQSCRAFLLNVDPQAPIGPREPDIAGRGYFVADTPNVEQPYFDATASMLRVNEKRLRLLQHYYMSDPQMLGMQAKAQRLLEQAGALRASRLAVPAMNTAARAFSLAINTHPAVREKLSNAVLGVLWYLLLLIPFVLFLEKLVFGFIDIRKQLLTYGLIFICAYALLLIFHPAFHIVRSPLMILLGFLIAMLSLTVTAMMSGRFQQAIKYLRQREGRVEEADINRSGVIATAFLLGLNNMRRRKVRTGLTCVTLVLISFAMICFTSVSRDVQQEERLSGTSQCDGIFRRNMDFSAITQGEMDAMEQLYGMDYPVVETSWLTGTLGKVVPQNAEIFLERTESHGGEQLTNRSKVSAAISMNWNGRYTGLERVLCTPNRGWFPRPPQTEEEKRQAARKGYIMPNYVLVPDAVARELGLTAELVATTHQMVSIKDTPFEVLGIIDSAKLNKFTGIDGQSILPFDLTALTSSGTTGNGTAKITPGTRRLSAAQVIITSTDLTPKAGDEQLNPVSCAVVFPKEVYQLRPDQPVHPAVSYHTQRELVDDYLESIGIPAYYAIDGMAYLGRRYYGKSLNGLIELLIPLLIAALTVFNTMRGSVYERREEIFIYNALGIAPNHVFFMFMAEACVYGVMGAMLGYLLSQITGTALVGLGVQGLSRDYSSIETVYVSMVLVVTVLLSALMPAREAARIASPSGEAGWSMPKVDGNRLQFNLPFTFTPHDRMAIISYFYRWLDANGEGMLGAVFRPSAGIAVARRHRRKEWTHPRHYRGDLAAPLRFRRLAKPHPDLPHRRGNGRVYRLRHHRARQRRRGILAADHETVHRRPAPPIPQLARRHHDGAGGHVRRGTGVVHRGAKRAGGGGVAASGYIFAAGNGGVN